MSYMMFVMWDCLERRGKEIDYNSILHAALK